MYTQGSEQLYTAQGSTERAHGPCASGQMGVQQGQLYTPPSSTYVPYPSFGLPHSEGQSMVPPEVDYDISNQGSPPQIATYAREQHCGGHFVQTPASCSTQPYVQCASLGGVCPQSRMYDDPPSNMWAPPSQCGQPQSGSAHAPQAAQSSQCCAMAQMYWRRLRAICSP